MHLAVQLQRQIPILGDMGDGDGDTEMPHAEPEVESVGGEEAREDQLASEQTERGWPIGETDIGVEQTRGES